MKLPYKHSEQVKKASRVFKGVVKCTIIFFSLNRPSIFSFPNFFFYLYQITRLYSYTLVYFEIILLQFTTQSSTSISFS